MKSTPHVSWLMPVKNGMPYLSESLASIEKQTYTDFEVLVWDNGSIDGTIEELERWIPGRLPGKIITGQPQSLGGSRAQLIELSQAEFCACLDTDDIALPHRLDQQVAYMLMHPEIAVLGSNLKFIDAQGRDLGRQSTYPLIHEDIVMAMLAGNPIGQPSVILRRQAVRDAGNYKVMPDVEDYELWLRMAVAYKFANQAEILTSYRIHDRSTTQRDILANEHTEKVDKLFILHAAALFGMNELTARKFRSGQLRCMLIAAIDLARYRATKEGVSFLSVLRRPSFLDALQSRMRLLDIFSRLGLTMLDPRPGAFLHMVKRAFVFIIEKLPYCKRCLGVLEFAWERWKFAQWRAREIRRGSHIGSRLNFIGKKQPYPWLEFGAKVIIEKDVTIWISDDEASCPNLNLGTESFIGFRTYLGVYQPMRIGQRVLIGANCYLISGNHRYTRRDIPISKQGFSGAPIIIEDDVWIGTHVTVLPGVTIGRGAIIGAGSLVNRDIPAWEVWGGVPAKFLKHRPT